MRLVLVLLVALALAGQARAQCYGGQSYGGPVYFPQVQQFSGYSLPTAQYQSPWRPGLHLQADLNLFNRFHPRFYGPPSYPAFQAAPQFYGAPQGYCPGGFCPSPYGGAGFYQGGGYQGGPFYGGG